MKQAVHIIISVTVQQIAKRMSITAEFIEQKLEKELEASYVVSEEFL